MESFILLLRTSIKLATVFLFGSIGETLTEKSGHLNLGIPGIMCIGAVGGALGESIYIQGMLGGNLNAVNPFLSVFIPIIFTLIFGALAGLLYSFLCVTLKSNQNVVGLILTTLGGGLSILLLSNDTFIKKNGFYIPGKYFDSLFFPGAIRDINSAFVRIFLSHGILTYIAIILAIIVAIYLRRSKKGLALRAVGENPATADAAGINVNKTRYLATVIGSAVAALGGLFVMMDYSKGTFEPNVIDAYGWLAVALVIFTTWRTDIAILGSFIFAVCYNIPDCFEFPGEVMKLLKLVPYAMTIIVLIITSIAKVKGSQPPAALGTNYFREDR